MACADGIQECIETVRDLKANNAEEAYLKGLDKKIKAVEKRAIISRIGYCGICGFCNFNFKIGYCNGCFGRRLCC